MPRSPRPVPAAASGPAGDRLVRRLATAAVLLQFTLSANLFTAIGIPYADPGGDPLLKFHPATWAVAFGMLRLAAVRRDRLAAETLCPVIGGLVAVIAYSVLSVGPSGAAVYVESWVSPVALAILLCSLPQADRAAIGRLALGLIALDVALAFGETATESHLIPIHLEDHVLVDAPGEFRSAALFDHPLTAAMATMTALLCLPALRPSRAWGCATALWLAAGLLAFGGRGALLASAIAGSGAGAVVLARLALARRLTGAMCVSILLGGLALVACAAAVLALTPLGGRVMAHLYLDGSAQSRSVEWLLLGDLDTRSLLFGTPISVTPGLIYRLGLRYPFTDIENFWLMAFLDLGIVGFALYAASVASFLAILWRRAAHPAQRIAIVCLIVVASSSNSLGRKCNVMTVLVTFVCAGPLVARRPAPGSASARHLPASHFAARPVRA